MKIQVSNCENCPFNILEHRNSTARCLVNRKKIPYFYKDVDEKWESIDCPLKKYDIVVSLENQPYD